MFSNALFLELVAQVPGCLAIGMAKVAVSLFLMRIVVNKWHVSLQLTPSNFSVLLANLVTLGTKQSFGFAFPRWCCLARCLPQLCSHIVPRTVQYGTRGLPQSEYAI